MFFPAQRYIRPWSTKEGQNLEDALKLIEALSAWSWPAVAVLAMLLFRRDLRELIARIKRGRVSGVEFELDEFQAKVARADAQVVQVAEDLPARPQLLGLPGPEGDDKVLSRAVQAPKAALMLLASDIERELRQLLAATGWHQGKPFTPVPLGIERVARMTPMPEALTEAVQQFWPIRSKLVHGHDVNDGQVLRAIDAGLVLLKAIRAVPHETNVVHHSGVEVFGDQAGTTRVDGVRALILETTSSDGQQTKFRVFPTTRTDYVKGKRVAWEWSSRNTWKKCWYRDPDSREIRPGWDSSMEFVGRHLDEL